MKGIKQGTKAVALYTFLLLALTAWSTAQSGRSVHFHSQFSGASHYDPIKIFDSKKLPSSTVDVGLPTAVRTKSGSSSSELSGLEHQMASELQTEVNRGSRNAPAVARFQPSHAHEPDRGSGINFSYHASHGGQAGRSSASRTGRLH